MQQQYRECAVHTLHPAVSTAAPHLQRCACDEQAPLAVEAQQRLPALALPVLDHVRLVQDEVLPLLATEHLHNTASMNNV
jgi:hypothetical protein